MSCNLFGIHTGFSKAKVTSVIDLQTAKNLENKFSDIVSGLKFCPKCLNSFAPGIFLVPNKTKIFSKFIN